jgi:hypothetical protein
MSAAHSKCAGSTWFSILLQISYVCSLPCFKATSCLSSVTNRAILTI